MRLIAPRGFAKRLALNDGGAATSAHAGRHCRTGAIALALLFGMLLPHPTLAQQVSQPGFDPKQTEKRFENLESGQTQPARAGIKLPKLAQPQAGNDTRPQFELRAVTITGATAVPQEKLA